MTKKRYANAMLSQVRAELAREPWSSASEIADMVGCGPTAARKWLRLLVKRGSAVRVVGVNRQHRFALNRHARKGGDARVQIAAVDQQAVSQTVRARVVRQREGLPVGDGAESRENQEAPR